MPDLLQTKYTAGVICLFLCGLTACSTLTEIGTRHRDAELFERSMDAARQKRFSTARLALETLINTYPDSQYARRARVALEDPLIASCGDSWMTAPDCGAVLETIEPQRQRVP